MATITGVAKRPSGAIFADLEISFVPVPGGAFAIGSGSVISDTVTTTTDENGEVDFTLEPGVYGGRANGYRFAFVVGEADSYDFSDCLEAAETDLTPAVLQQCIDARDAAEAARDQIFAEGGQVTLTGTQTLTNKTINLASNTLVATSAQLRAALTDETGTGAAVFAGSPALTGTPTAPTAAQGTSTTQVATTAFVTDTGVTLTRAQLVTRCASGWRAVAGQILWAGGVAYVGSAGATAISDLPGLLPAINVTYAHFGAAGVGGNDTTAIDAAHAYLTTMWTTSPGAAGVPVGALPLHIPVGRWRSSAGRVYTVPGTGFTVTGDGPAAQLDQVDFALGGHARCSFSDFSMRGATAIGLNLSSGSGVNTAKGFYRNIYIRDKTTAGITLNGAQHNKFVSCFVEECGIGLQFLGGAGNNFTNCDFQQCVTYGVDIRSNGELRMNSCRARGTGFGSAAAGGWANLNVYTTGDPVLEHYFVDCSFSGAQYGGRRYAITSIADNGSGKIRVTTSVPHELAPGLIDVQLNGTAAYDAGGAIAAVLDVISPTIFDMDRAYTAPAGAVGNVWLEGWDIQMVNAGGLGDINDMFFTGGNANYVKLDGVYNFVSNGRIPKQQLWLTDNAANNQIYLQRSARGRSAQTQRDVVPSGPGAYRGWGETVFGRDNPTSFAVDGGERVAIRMPNTAAGVAVNNLPAAFNESAIMADGLRWRVNGKEATIKDVGGVLTMEGVNKIVEPTLTGIIALEEQVAQLAGNEAAMQLAITNSSLKRASRFAARAALAIATDAAWEPITGLGAKLVAWWDADSYATHMVDDGAGLISSWTDRVLGRAVTATTTARPTYQAAGLYGRPCVSFDGVANVLSTTTLTGLPTGSAAGGLVAVTGPWVAAATTHAVGYGSTSANAARRLSTNTGGIVNSSNGTIAQTGTTANVALNVLIAEWNVTTASLHQNGVTSSDSPEAVTMATATSYFRVGASLSATPSQFTAVQITDIMVIDGILTPYERRKLESYLAHKRGVPNILPATHAFAAYPPRALPAKPSPYAYRYATTGSGGGKMSSASAAVGAYTGFKGRIVQKIGNDDVSEIKIGWSNWYIDNLATSGAETDNPDAITISKVAVVYDGIMVPVTFDGGSRSVVLAAGETLKLSDTINASDFGFDRFKAGTLFQVRYMGTLAGASAKMLFNARDPNDFGGVNKGQGFWYDPAFAVDDVDATGSMTTPTGNQGDLIIKPTAIIGKYDSAVPVVEVFGDSIPHGLNDFYSGGWSSNGVGGANGKVNGGGFMRRALGNLGMAYSMTTKVGHRYEHMAANYAKRATFFKYSTHAVFTLGTNDVNAGTSAAAIMAFATPIWAAYRASGGQGIIHTTIVPRIVANDWAGTDLEHQTHNPGYELGGERDKLNAALRNARSVTLDEVVDIARPVSDRNNPSKWAIPNYRATLAVASLSTDTSLTFSAPPTAEMALILEPGLPTVDKGAYNVLSVSGNVATFSAAPMAAGHSIGASVAATLADDGTHPSAQAQRMMAQEVAAALVMLEAVS